MIKSEQPKQESKSNFEDKYNVYENNSEDLYLPERK